MQKYQKALAHLPKQANASSFKTYIINSGQNKQMIFESIRSCKVDEIQTRFNIWRLELGILSFQNDLKQKVQEIKLSRQQYTKKKSQALSGYVEKKQVKIPKNPLMKAMMKSPKQEQTSDGLLREDIKKDVQRTYQEMPFFQDQNILKLLTTVLFVWCKKNVAYQQGMNQVLASIVYVYFTSVYTPNRQPQNFNELNQEQKQAYILFNTIDFCEADIYLIFEKVMDIQQDMYKTEADSQQKVKRNPNSKNNTPILQRIITLIDQKLKLLDLQLFRAIKLQDVQTKTFLLRWIRCMHTREFSLQNSFLIWDSIFLDYYGNPNCRQKNVFEFIDSMCLAMFIYMRSIALTRQTAYEIQQIYQKYPQLKKGGYLEQLISLAWSLCDALRNPVNQSTSDWYGQQSNRIDNKLQFMKSTQSQKSPQPQIKRQSPRHITQAPKDIVKKQSNSQHKPQKKQENPAIKTQVQSSTENITKQYTRQQILIHITNDQWTKLHDNLANSIHLTTNAQVRQWLQASMHMLQQKVNQSKNK